MRAMNAPSADGACRNGLRVQILTQLEELEAVRTDWHRLWRSVEGCAVGLMPEYVIPYLRYRLPPGAEWVCVLVLDGEELIGVFPAVYGLADLLPQWGRRFAPPHEFYSDFIVADGQADEVFRVVLPALGEVVPGWRRLDLRRVREDSATLGLPAHPLPEFRVVEEERGFGSYLQTVGSFEDYYQGLSKNFRGNLRKARNKLDQLREVKFVLRTPQEFALGDFWGFVDLEAAGWKGARGAAIKYRQGWSDFYQDFTVGLARAGCLVWNCLQAEGRVIAAQIAVRTGSRLTVFKIAYDEDYARCAPGNLLWSRVLEEAFASDEIREVDALSDMSWHRDWKMAQRRYYNLCVVPKRLVPAMLRYCEELRPDLWGRTKRALAAVPGLRPLVHAVRRWRPGIGTPQ